MVKTISSKISDPRPRINVTLSSDDDKTEAMINKGYVNVQRGKKKSILRIPFGEVTGVIELLEAAKGVVTDNGYDADGGSEIEANAEPEDATEVAAGAPGNAEDAGVVSAVTEGAGAPEVAPETPLTSETDAQQDVADDPAASAARVDQRNNPFANTAA